jgi:hypothetical protein
VNLELVTPAGSGRVDTRGGASVMRPKATALGRLALVLLVASGLIVAYLTVALAPDVDPVRTVVSDYAFYRPGLILLMLGGALLVAGGMAVLAGMMSLHLTRQPALRALFLLWALSLLVCVAFKPDPESGASSSSGDIHSVAAACVLTSFPLAAWTAAAVVAENPAWSGVAMRIRQLLGLGCLAAAVFGLCQFPTSGLTMWIPVGDVEGLAERIALGTELAVLMTIARSIARVDRMTPVNAIGRTRRGRSAASPVPSNGSAARCAKPDRATLAGAAQRRAAPVRDQARMGDQRGCGNASPPGQTRGRHRGMAGAARPVTNVHHPRSQVQRPPPCQGPRCESQR